MSRNTTTNSIRIIDKTNFLKVTSFRSEIESGLYCSPKYISPKYFYDSIGSELFESITHLEEYYPTRTEKSILKHSLDQCNIDFENLDIIELGSGDHSKIELLLAQIPHDLRKTVHYYAADISSSAILKSGENLQIRYPEIEITGVVVDFMQQLNEIPKNRRRLFCFFGSTLGNLTTKEQQEFITNLGISMQTNDQLLLGIDMVKDVKTVELAYNDSKGVTANFNRNILSVINSMVGANFDLEQFEHYAFYNKKINRIEMHLRAKTPQKITLPDANHPLFIKQGETIHTENSHKFVPKQIDEIAVWGGFKVNTILKDKNNWFSLVLYNKIES